MMSTVDYLAIPELYFDWLGGLRWSEDGEAIEYVTRAEGQSRTFALAPEVALFLEGYQSAEPVACFGFVLHILDLLGVGRRSEVVETFASGRQPAELAYLFRECGRPFFNAGALAASLGREWPPARVQPDLREVGLRLARRPTALVLRRALRLPEPPSETPVLRPLIFSARVLKALAALSTDELRHWLRTGRPPAAEDVGEPIAEAAEAARPHSLALVLARLEARQRLKGAQPLVAQLLGAFTLPPRRLATADLPTGGYADLTTRGQPEHLLPGQFALDPMEFLRRFAERELLYHHREEPNAPTTEELVVVLDQGVRTWGGTRLVLAAAALALGRLAERRGWRLRLVTTGEPDRVVDPLEIDEDTLGKQFESSDLSASPADALAGALTAPPPSLGLRDVVLLTHARALIDPSVVAVCRRLDARTRLFGVGVNTGGDVEFVEMVGGGAIRRARCRVQAGAPPMSEPVPRTDDPAVWTGDVEPIGFPFRLGISRPVEGRLLAFDEAGDWLFLGSGTGLVHAWRIDGSDAEVLPRGTVGGHPLAELEALIGVAGGLVACGWVEGRLVAVHHDMNGHRVRSNVLANLKGRPELSLQYFPDLHCVVVRAAPEEFWAVDLGELGTSFSLSTSEPTVPRTTRASEALDRAIAHHESLARLQFTSGNAVNRYREVGLVVRYDLAERCLRVTAPDRPPMAVKTLTDGQDVFEKSMLRWAEWRGDVLAASFMLIGRDRPPPGASLRLYRAPEGSPICEVNDLSDPHGFTLSRDGRLLAYKLSDRQFAVRAVDAGPGQRLLSPRGRIHGRIDVELGDDFLLARTGEPYHIIRWDQGLLERSQGRADPRAGIDALNVRRGHATTRLSREPLSPMPTALADTRRFVAWGQRKLWAAVDQLSQIILLAPEGDLLCVFFLFRDQFAAWMPDGTRLGPPPLIGGPATPDAARRIGSALKRAGLARSESERVS
jgi:hypothetical protein